MYETTLNAFFDELEAIEKDAGLRETLKGLKAKSKKTSESTRRLTLKATHHPRVQKVLRYLQDPMNTADFAQGLANLSRFIH